MAAERRVTQKSRRHSQRSAEHERRIFESGLPIYARCDQFFYGTLILGTLTSALAAIWKFILRGSSAPGGGLIDRLTELTARIRSAKSEAELEAIENEINAILQAELDGLQSEEAALNVAAARLERLIHQRTSKLGAVEKPGEAATA